MPPTDVTTIPLDQTVGYHTRSFLEEVMDAVPGAPGLSACIQCGTCGGSCPSGPDMEHTPRQLFAMINANMRSEVLRSNTPWYCVSCYFCMVRCPQNVQITDIMYALKRKAIEAGESRRSSAADAPKFSEAFVNFVENYGRSFELGVAARFHFIQHPGEAIKMAASIGIGMMRKGRMDLTPTRIKGVTQLKTILSKARELGGTA